MKRSLAKAALAGAAVASTAVGLAAAAPLAARAGTSVTASGWSSHLSTDQVHSFSAKADHRVIILLRNEHTNLAGRDNEAARARAFTNDRAPIVGQLRQLHASRIMTYGAVNAIATTVSSAEEANLRNAAGRPRRRP